MRVSLLSTARYLFLIVAFSLACSIGSQAQEVRFVQITDPHLFDPGQDEAENKAALAACIKTINEEIDGRADFKFAVVTGDLGIENLISELKDKERILEDDQSKREQQLDQGASQLASILAASRIRVWLFLPGNNDLFKETPDTQYYRVFISKLRSKLPGLEVIDLCPEEPEDNKHELGVYSLGNLAFIGFNNASFKNDNLPERITTNKERQLEYVRQVERRLESNDIRSAYVFYHIPELDDPHIVLNFDTEILSKRQGYAGNPYPYSSWFVERSVQEEWKNQVVNNPKVRGLFAGHYHDWRRNTYISYQWMQTSNYLSGSLSKLYISPPLAIKRQSDAPAQARGFQEVTIDGMGRVSTRVMWLDPAQRTFDTDPSSRSNQLQLALFYEATHQWAEAQTNFAEVAKSAPSVAVRDAALAGLRRVQKAQHPDLKEALRRTEWLSTFWALVLRVLPVLAVLLALFIIGLAIYAGFRAMVIYPFDGDEALSKRLAVGFPAIRAKVVSILGPSVTLPQTVSTVYPFVAPRLEDMFPQESFEIGGMKVPNLSIILKWIARPRFRVTGGILQVPPNRYCYAEVWRRSRNWFGSYLATIVTREIPTGATRTREIETFIIDVYLKSNATL